MKQFSIAGLVAVVLSAAAPTTQLAQSHPDFHYRGGCTFAANNEDLPAVTMGLPYWTGGATAVVVATTADNSRPVDETISFECTLWRNGTTNLGAVLSSSGRTVAADTDATFTYTAHKTDTLQVCREVTVGTGAGAETHGDASTFDTAWCAEVDRTPLAPEPATNVVNAFVDELNTVSNPFGQTESFVCTVLTAIGPVVNGLDLDVVRIDTDPAGGPDVWILGTELWACPDYAM